MTGTTIASMMPSEFSRICRSAAAIGPCGSSTPSVQPPSVAAPITTAVSKPCRMSDLPRVEAAACLWREPGTPELDGAARMRGTHERQCITAVIDQERCENDEQIGDGENE